MLSRRIAVPKYSIAVLESMPNSPFCARIESAVASQSREFSVFRIALSNFDAGSGLYRDGNTSLNLPQLIQYRQITGYFGPGNKYDIPPDYAGVDPESVDFEKITVPPEESNRLVFEAAFFVALIEANVPIFAVCGSTQHLGVLAGYQMRYNVSDDLSVRHNPYYPKSTAFAGKGLDDVVKEVPQSEFCHSITLTKQDTWIGSVSGSQLTLASFHNHAVSPVYQEERDQLLKYGVRLHPVGFDDLEKSDPVVEALENIGEGPLIIAVQGHPEITDGDALIPAFIRHVFNQNNK